MADTQEIVFGTTREWLLHNIHRFLEANLEHDWLDGEAFGWASCRDSGLMDRLENGGDCRTGKMDAILAYIQNPVPPSRWVRATLTPIKLTRRVYE